MVNLGFYDLEFSPEIDFKGQSNIEGMFLTIIIALQANKLSQLQPKFDGRTVRLLHMI